MIGVVVCVGGKFVLVVDEYVYDLVYFLVSFKVWYFDISWIHGWFNEVVGKFLFDWEQFFKLMFELMINVDSVDMVNKVCDEYLW